MKGEAGPVARQKPHVRAVVAMLRGEGATDIVVTQPKHYRVRFELGGRSLDLVVPSTPRCRGNQAKLARQRLRRMGVLA